MARLINNQISGSAAFFIGIAAIVTSLLAISFIILGFLIDSYGEVPFGDLIYLSGMVLIPISVLFIAGLWNLRKRKTLGVKLVSIASVGVIVLLAFSGGSTIIASPGWKLSLLVFVLCALIFTPFIWLIIYLRKLT